MSYGVFFNDNGLEKLLTNAVKELPKVVDTAVRISAAETLGQVKREWPKRSGEGARSFTTEKEADFHYRVFSGLVSTVSYESGSKAAVILPKRKKFLLFSTDESKKDRTGRVKEAARRRFFEKLKKAKNKAEKYSVMQTENIYLAKKVNKPAMAGHFLLRDKVSIFASETLQARVYAAITGLLK